MLAALVRTTAPLLGRQQRQRVQRGDRLLAHGDRRGIGLLHKVSGGPDHTRRTECHIQLDRRRRPHVPVD